MKRLGNSFGCATATQHPAEGAGLQVLVALALTASSMFVAPFALAATFFVNSTVDLPDDLTVPGVCHTTAGTCTLRAAVMQSLRTAGPSAVSIIVPAGTYTLTIMRSADNVETDGDLELLSPSIPVGPTISIQGAGVGTTFIDGNNIDRVFHVHLNRQVSISRLTINNGRTLDSGGGIWNEGFLSLDNVAIVNNNANANGGGIYNATVFSTLSITNSVIGTNNVGGTGGGIVSEGSLTLSSSTISQNMAVDGGGLGLSGKTTYVRSSLIRDNTAGVGGGIFNQSPTTYIIDSTVAQNTASQNAGGIFNNRTTNVYSSSIVFNVISGVGGGSTGAGVFSIPGAVFNIRNTIIAGNYLANPLTYSDCAGPISTYGTALFFTFDGCTIDNHGFDYLTGSLTQFGPLQDNGGPTSTIALLPGSSAIDKGLGCIDDQSVPLATDQRGAPRIHGASCDVGAYEFNSPLPPVVVSNASRKVHGAAGTFDLPLNNVVINPTTEPRQGPAQTIVFTFDKAISSATATVPEGVATVSARTFSGNDVIVDLTGVSDQQYVTITLSNVTSADGGTGGSASVRIGFLMGDVNQNRVVTVSDVGLTNAEVALPLSASNFLKDINANGALTVSDKGLANSAVTHALPAP